jgi:hypothetical protein
MDTQNLLNVPKPKPRVIAKISKIENLVEISKSVNKSSAKLRKAFETGSYQKRTQLAVLKRYKKRLDSIYNNNDKNFDKKKKVKIKKPDIKKFSGNLFTSGVSDPFKSIGMLAAFNAASKLGNGKPFEALGPALVASGIFLAPAALKLAKFALPGGGLGDRMKGPKITTSKGKDISGYRNPLKNNPRSNIQNPLNRGSGGPRITGTGSDKLMSRASKGFSRFGKAIIPVAGAALGAIDTKMRSDEGDLTGAAISGTSAALDTAAAGSALTGIGLPVAGLLSIASFSLDVVNLARDLFGMSENESKLSKQTKNQKELVSNKSQDAAKLTFKKTLISYDAAICKFEKFAQSFSGVPAVAKNYVEGAEQLPPPPPPGQNIVADTQVIQDAIDFRNSFPLARGTPQVSMQPMELHMRENLMLHKAGIGNDPTVERVHVTGSAHYEDRAIDIPVNSKALGDKVNQFWKSRGYSTLWQVAGHFNHVHVQWNPSSSQTMPTSGNGKKGYIIIPGHATGGGAPGEKELVKKLAQDAYSKIKMKNPNSPVQYMDLDSMFTDDDAGFKKQGEWYEKTEKAGYEILEIHMDGVGGKRGVIRSHGSQSGAATEFASKFGSFPMRHRSPTNDPNHPNKAMRPLAGPHRGVDLFELGVMQTGKSYSSSDISKLTSDFASMDFSLASARNSIASAVRTVQIPRSISSYPSYSQSSIQPRVIPVPISIPASGIKSNISNQMPRSSAPSFAMIEDSSSLLNSFYKRVLLNTLQ